MKLSLSTRMRILIPTYLLEMERLRFSWLDLSPTYSAQFVADVNAWAAHFLEHWHDGGGLVSIPAAARQDAILRLSPNARGTAF